MNFLCSHFFIRHIKTSMNQTCYFLGLWSDVSIEDFLCVCANKHKNILIDNEYKYLRKKERKIIIFMMSFNSLSTMRIFKVSKLLHSHYGILVSCCVRLTMKSIKSLNIFFREILLCIASEWIQIAFLSIT